ncbi:MAG: apolipoprotein N-acyltransferase, partial [Desulfohalobiaceae bacterium]|nr:apolipoprotein N-acyltransferase [Desulfohalobiaceae bacterium]
MKYLICILGAWFGFANPVYQVPLLVLLLPASLTAFGLEADNPRDALFHGWLAGTLAFSACLYWVAIPVHNFGPLPWVLSATCPLLLGVYFGLYTGVYALAVQWAGKRLHWLLLALYSGLIWTVLEYLRAHLLTGFPWLTLSQAFGPWPVTIQIAAYIGAFGLSGLLVAICVWLLRFPKTKNALIPALLACALILVSGYGLLQQPPSGDSSVRVAVVQGNIEQNRKWDREYQQDTVEKYLRLSREALEESSAELLVWPETAAPFHLQEDSALRQRISAFCREQQTALLTGAPGYRKTEDTTHLYNRGYLIDERGSMKASYAKIHLVPFGEYVPLGSWIPYVDKLVPGMGDFSPGRSAAPLEQGDLALGPLICYEVIFPHVVQERVDQGANLLLNISNDAWFGRSSGPRQHWNQAVLRAVEQG